MKMFFASIAAWFQGVFHSHAITEDQISSMQEYMKWLNLDPENPGDRERFLKVSEDFFRKTNLIPLQAGIRAAKLSGRIVGQDLTLKAIQKEIARLQLLIETQEQQSSNVTHSKDRLSKMRDRALNVAKRWS